MGLCLSLALALYILVLALHIQGPSYHPGYTPPCYCMPGCRVLYSGVREPGWSRMGHGASDGAIHAATFDPADRARASIRPINRRIIASL